MSFVVEMLGHATDATGAPSKVRNSSAHALADDLRKPRGVQLG